MKAIMLMFDSLNKHMLSAYGNTDTITPNFTRLAQHSARFNNAWVGSMPCMPARRELHTGRYNFLHRGWGPLEPFDLSVPEMLRKHGIHTHLVTDHKHYWRDGGATYHSRFSSYEFIRGQEGDNWKGVVGKPHIEYHSGEPDEIKQRKVGSRTQHLINQRYMQEERDHPLARTIAKGLEFIDTNHASDNWFLQLECFDPHEPFYVPDRFLAMYGLSADDFDGWPPYYLCTEDDAQKQTIQGYYKALLTMVDCYVGEVLDRMDQHDLWKDTVLIVNTDHGFLLGEHEWWGKNIMPLYNEIARVPFFFWHPTFGQKDVTREALMQTIDIPATLLDIFDVPAPPALLGKSLIPALAADLPVREYALFGYHGCHINITDGQYVYMRSPVVTGTDGLFEYTLMPTRINRRFSPEELRQATLSKGFSFTQGCPVLRVPATTVMTSHADRFGHRLYHLQTDPQQTQPLHDLAVEYRLINQLRMMLLENEAPAELFRRYGLSQTRAVTLAQLKQEHQQASAAQSELDYLELAPAVKFGALCLLRHLVRTEQWELRAQLRTQLTPSMDCATLTRFVIESLPPEQHNAVLYNMALEMRLE